MSTEALLASSGGAGRLMGRLLRSNVFAWTLSILLHAGLFLVFYQMGSGKTATARRLIIPEARLLAGPAPVLPSPDQPVKLSDKQPGAAPSVGRPPRMDELPILSVPLPGPLVRETVVSGPPRLALPGVDAAGTGTGLGAAGVGVGGTAIGPVSRFFGQAGNAYKVVYVADLSASLLLMYAEDLVEEMQSSIRDLVPTQEFHIVFAMPGEVREMELRRLVAANARYKNMAYDFIKQSTAVAQKGRANPGEALRRAFAVKPELIYFLTDGAYFELLPGKNSEYSDLELALKKLNPNSEVKITVIGYGLSMEKAGKSGQPVAQPPQVPFLERIAREHGGHFRIVEAQ